jgi:hypothetical protein
MGRTGGEYPINPSVVNTALVPGHGPCSQLATQVGETSIVALRTME